MDTSTHTHAGAPSAPAYGIDVILARAALAALFLLGVRIITMDGRQPSNWDWLELSGFLWLSVGLFLGSKLRVAHATSLDALVKRGTLTLDFGVEEHMRRLERQAVFCGWAGTVLLPTLFWFGIHAARPNEPGWVIWWVAISVLFGYPFGRTMGWLLANVSWEVKSLTHSTLRVVPGHYDGAGGLKPLGDLLLARGRIAVVALVHIGLGFILIPRFHFQRYHTWSVVYAVLLVVALLLITATCGPTALRAHALLATLKANQTERLHILVRTHAHWRAHAERETSLNIDRLTEARERLTALEGLCRDIDKLPSWPSDVQSLERLQRQTVAAGIPLLIGLLKVFGIVEGLQDALGL